MEVMVPNSNAEEYFLELIKIKSLINHANQVRTELTSNPNNQNLLIQLKDLNKKIDNEYRRLTSTALDVPNEKTHIDRAHRMTRQLGRVYGTYKNSR